MKELIEYLENIEAVGPLTWQPEISLAAKDHVMDKGPAGEIGHEGSDGSQVGDRLNHYGRYNIQCGENLSFGDGNGRDIVIQLLIDDGVPDRSHRHTMFNPHFKVMGCFSGPHKQYGSMSCIDYAGGWR